jgi:pimeloyl-ACP methyl ester carboxylesterase
VRVGKLNCGVALAVTLGAAACSKHEQASTPSQANTTAPQAYAEGSPRIANSGDGVHIEYQVYGSGDLAVVLVHGWSCDATYWKAQLDDLKAKYTTVTVNLAGHGASGRNRTDWSMENYGEDVASVVRQLRNRRVVLVGHSMGGPVVLEAANRIGDRVIGIIAVDALKSIGQPLISPREVEMRLKPFRADFIGHTRELVTKALFAPGADPVFVQRVAYDMSLEPPEVAIPSMEALARLDFGPLVKGIHVPVVAINSDLGPPTDAARIGKSLPGFRAIVLEHTSHFLMMEVPQKFNPVLLREIDAMASQPKTN